MVQLDLLLLLHADAARPWTAAEAAAELRAPEPWIDGQLADLAAAGLTHATGAKPPAFRFDAHSPLAAVVDELAELAERRRTTIIRLIHAPTADVQSFSDAFRFRRDED